MRRLVKLAAIVIPATTLVGAVILLVYLQSSAFDEFLRERAIRELEQRFAVRAELDSLSMDWTSTAVVLRGLRLYDSQYPVPEPALELPVATVDFSLTGLLRPKATLDDLQLKGLIVRVLGDPNGRLNLVNMFRNPTGPPPNLAKLIALGIRRWSLDSGVLVFQDKPIRLASSQGDMDLEVRFFPEQQRYAGILKLTGVDFEAGAVGLAPVDLDIKFELLDNSIEFPSLLASTPALEMEQRGAIDDLVSFTYHFSGLVRARPSQFQQPDLAGELRSGEFLARGAFSGRGRDFRYRGRLESEVFQWRGFRFRDFSTDVRLDRSSMVAENLSFGFEGGRVRGTGELAWEKARRSHFQLRADGLQLSRLAPWLQSAELQVRGTADSEAEVGWPGLRFSEIAGQGKSSFSGSLILPQTPLSPAAFPFEGQSPFQVKPGGVSFSEGRIRTLDSQIEVTGEVGFGSEYRLNSILEAQSGRSLLAFASLSPLWPEWWAPRPLPSSGTVSSRFQVAGNGGRFALQGEAEMRQVGLQGELLGDLTVDYRLTPGELALKRFLLEGDPHRMEGSLEASLGDGEAGVRRLQLKVARVPLRNWASLLAVQSPVEGDLTGQFHAAAGTSGELEGTGSFQVDNPHLWERSLEKLAADFEIREEQIRLSSLDAGMLGGEIKGQVGYRPSNESFEVALQGNGLQLGRLEFWPSEIPVAGRASVSLSAGGNLTDYSLRASLQAPRFKIGEYTFQALALEALRRQPQDPGIDLQLRADFLGNPLLLKGEVSAGAPHTFQARTDFTQTPLGPYLNLLPSETRIGLEGELTGTASLQGSLDDPSQARAQATFSEVRLRAESYAIENQDPLILNYAGQRLQLQPVRFTGRDTQFQLSGDLDLRDEPAVTLKTDGFLNLLLLNPFLEGGSTLGLVRLETILSGPLRSPRIVGDARLEKVFLQHPSLPTPLFDTTGRLRFTANQVSIDELSTRTAFGTLNAEGGVFLEGFRPVRWLVNFYGSGLRLEYPEQVFSNLDLDVDFMRNDQSRLLSGVVYVRSAEYAEEISLPELLLRYTGTPSLAPTVPAEEVVLDIAVEGYRTVQIDNNLAQITASGDFKIRGTLDNPVILGSLTVDDGKLFLENNEYEITRGVINFKNPRRTRPEFSFEAETDVRDVSVNIILTGPVDQLKVSFRSDPPLPTPSIVSLLAVGQTQEELFGTEGGQERVGSLALFGAGALLSKSLGRKLQAQSSRLFGFDKVSIDPFLFGSERNPGARVTLGKQLGNRASVTYSTDLGNQTQGQIVVVEFKITDWLTAVGTGEQDGTLAIDFKLKKRF